MRVTTCKVTCAQCDQPIEEGQEFPVPVIERTSRVNGHPFVELGSKLTCSTACALELLAAELEKFPTPTVH